MHCLNDVNHYMKENYDNYTVIYKLYLYLYT